jgi:hypothetical protein
MEEKILYPKGGYEIQSYGKEKIVVDVMRSTSFSSRTPLLDERKQRYKHMTMKTQRLSSHYAGEFPIYTSVWVDNLLPDPRSFSEDDHDDKMSQADRKDSLRDEDDEKKSFSKFSSSKSSKAGSKTFKDDK